MVCILSSSESTETFFMNQWTDDFYNLFFVVCLLLKFVWNCEWNLYIAIELNWKFFGKYFNKIHSYGLKGEEVFE